ncbi:GH12 family glycosyl hydrolase domain-containing protein [Streptomyces sp. NPDC054796]
MSRRHPTPAPTTPTTRTARTRRALVLAPLLAALGLFGSLAAPSQAAPASPAAAWETCDQWGTWQNGGYTLYNNIWGQGAGSQCIAADSASRWTVRADHPNTGGVKSYPNAKYVVGRPISGISTLNSTFDVTVPSAGAYNTSYDVWDSDYQHEIMIWPNWHGAVGPIGGKVTDVSLGGRQWAVYKGSNGNNNVYSFLAAQQTKSGRIDIKPVLDWIVRQGWMPSNEVIGDVQFGYEITSSSGGLDFRTNSFGVTAN